MGHPSFVRGREGGGKWNEVKRPKSNEFYRILQKAEPSTFVAPGRVRGEVLGIPHLPKPGRYPEFPVRSSGERLVRQLELGASPVPKGRLRVAQDASPG
jgi:hypothetical protein